jgi:hypothetical protein
MGKLLDYAASSESGVEHATGEVDRQSEMVALLTELLVEFKRLGHSTANKLKDVDTPWLTTKEAAVYCRYDCDVFRKLVREYNIPKHGKSGNRYHRHELDEWIRDKRCFHAPSGRPRRRKVDPMSAIEDLLLWAATREKRQGDALL